MGVHVAMDALQCLSALLHCDHRFCVEVGRLNGIDLHEQGRVNDRKPHPRKNTYLSL